MDDCIATLAHYYGCHYEMMYADGFAILGNGCECRFASSYFIRLVNGPRNLTDYHGLTLHKKGPFTKRRMKKLIRDEIEEGLRSLIDELAYRDNIFNEVPSDELFWRSPLVGILLRMNQSIQSISGFVRYVAGELENEDLMALGERIWNLAITWKQARKLITKLYFMKRPDERLKEKTVQKMRLVVQELEKMPEQIQGVFLKGNCVKAPAKTTVESSGKTPSMAGNGTCFRQLDLTRWMNNKAFMYAEDLEKDTWKADFSSIGHCYLLDKECKQDIWRAGGIDFDMEAVYGSERDNVVCDGQTIPLSLSGCQSLALIGSAEFGCSTEIMKIIGKDGQEYEMEFHMTDYIYEPYYGETVAWTGKGAYKKEDGYEIMPETLYLYSQTYALPVENISSLELPINPSIHIFGITFICG